MIAQSYVSRPHIVIIELRIACSACLLLWAVSDQAERDVTSIWFSGVARRAEPILLNFVGRDWATKAKCS